MTGDGWSVAVLFLFMTAFSGYAAFSTYRYLSVRLGVERNPIDAAAPDHQVKS
ncbi:hypothetical protein D3C85_1862200 [compost metagenome]